MCIGFVVVSALVMPPRRPRARFGADEHVPEQLLVEGENRVQPIIDAAVLLRRERRPVLPCEASGVEFAKQMLDRGASSIRMLSFGHRASSIAPVLRALPTAHASRNWRSTHR